MFSSADYRIVRLANGAHSVHSLAEAETFHPVIGPVAEAEALYVRQMRLEQRMQTHSGPFVIWDVGLGAAANALTALRATRHVPGETWLVSFDHTLAPLEFALQNTAHLPYLEGYEAPLRGLLGAKQTAFQDGGRAVSWTMHLADFPTLLASTEAGKLPKPDAIMFDAFSPAKNPAMWTQPLFASVFRLLEPAHPCALPTYSRSTMLRVTLLLAGFFVGVGHATGEKEETTIAANSLALLEEPLDARWLQRVHRSTSAEPMWQPAYHQKPLAPETWEKLRHHPQFASYGVS